MVLEQRSGGYLRDPRLRLEAGALAVELTRWNGSWDEPIEERIVMPVRLAVAPSGSLEATLEAEILLVRAPLVPQSFADSRVRVEQRDGVCRVWLGADLVWEAEAIASAATSCEGPNGTWVAFHHDLREDTGRADLTKWIELRFIDSTGAIGMPAAPMLERDRDREGEEQGFEFPALVVGEDGALALYGRGSHSFYRQTLDARGFSERVALGPAGWGCRGLAPSLVANSEQVFIAYQDRRGIVLGCDALPRGGSPEIVRVATGARTTRNDMTELESFAAEASPNRARVPTRGLERGSSRPSGPDPARRWGRRTLFGDIHQHSAHSDGCGAADEPYWRARYRYRDDFCALSDHESFLGKRVGPGEWKTLCDAAERNDEPDVFSTLIAYEWTGRRYPGPGHKVVYSRRPGLPIVSRDHAESGEALLDRIAAQGGFAVPHHVGWTGADEDAHRPDVQPVWEICSCHGCYLYAEHPLGTRGELRDQMIHDVLSRGKRFGFIACSDGHGLLYHHGIARKRDPFRTGLTAVVARSNTRESIMDAIGERRCYATSGAPIYLDVIADSRYPMGSVLARTKAFSIEACAESIGLIDELALIGPEGPIAVVSGSGSRAEIRADALLPWVYARVTQRDGEMAWSSPIFCESGAND